MNYIQNQHFNKKAMSGFGFLPVLFKVPELMNPDNTCLTTYPENQSLFLEKYFCQKKILYFVSHCQ